MGGALGDFLDHEVFPRLTVEDIFTSPAHTPWHKRGTKWQGGCPFHESKTGTSFSVDETSLRWHCAGCQDGGGPLQYLHRLKGKSGTPQGEDFVDIVRELADLVGLSLPKKEYTPEERETARLRETKRSVLEVVISKAEADLWETPEGAAARKYLTGPRGFTDEDIRSLHLGYYRSTGVFLEALKKAGVSEPLEKIATNWNDLEGYILIPWMDARGRPLTLYGRWKEKTPPFMKDRPRFTRDRDEARAKWEALTPENQKKTPWEEPRIPKTEALSGEGSKASPLYFDRARAAGLKELVLVEGVFDAALLQARGDCRVVASVGSAVSDLQVETLVREKVRTVFICGDPDGGGDAGNLRNVKKLEAAGISTYVVPRLPDGLDPDEFLLRDGMDAWKERVSRSVPGGVFKATVELGAITPESPDRDRREAVERVLTVLEGLRGERAALDQEDILQRTAEATGYTPEALSEIAQSHEERRRKEKAEKALVDALAKAQKASKEKDVFSIARDLTKDMAALQTQEEPEPPRFSVERLWTETVETPPGIRTGWTSLDSLGVYLNPGELSLVAGRTGHAKTTVLVNLLLNILENEDTDGTVLFYSLEEPEVRVFHRLLSLLSRTCGPKKAGWTTNEIRSFARGEEAERRLPGTEPLETAKKRLLALENRLRVIWRPSWPVERVSAHVRTIAETTKVDAVLVDYVQRIAKSEKADRRDIEISHIGRTFKTLAVDVSVPVICGAQINREAIPKDLKSKVSEAEDYGTAMSTIRGARPELHNLREGGAEQEADLVLGLLNYAADYRTEAKKADLPDVTLLEIGTLKNRVGEVGRWCQLAFEGRYGLIRDPEPDEEKDLHVEASPSQYGRMREEALNKRSEDRKEREKTRLETEKQRTETERLRNERAAAKKPKTENAG